MRAVRIECDGRRDDRGRDPAGRFRGAAWLKIKPITTLDLVVLGAEWGSGRRRGWLSNLHLGARDAERNGFVMLGETYDKTAAEADTIETVRAIHRRATGYGAGRARRA